MIRVIDFETTGMTPPDAAICEIGWQDIEGEQTIPILGGGISRVVDPHRPMPPEACAVHHLTDSDVHGCPDAIAIFPELMRGVSIFAAHNAAFERQYFDGGGKPWICTLKAARRVWPNAPGHGNQVLRYWLGLKLDPQLAMPAHRAGPDAYVTSHILLHLLAEAELDDLIRWTDEPSLLPGAIRFGKHRGTAWSDLPNDYLAWIAEKSDLDADAKFTARHHLEAANV